MGAQPMYLGLDLRGGVHFLMDVDMEAAIEKNYNRYVDEIKATFRKERIRYLGVEYQQDHLMAKFRDAASVEAADKALQEAYPAQFNLIQKPDEHALEIRLLPKTLEEARTYALKQNITTLRNRINELGVAEPVIQQQGDRRIVVQLPGVQDTAKAKEILGATATLEFRLVEEKGDAARAEKTGYAPNGSRLYISETVARFY